MAAKVLYYSKSSLSLEYVNYKRNEEIKRYHGDGCQGTILFLKVSLVKITRKIHVKKTCYHGDGCLYYNTPEVSIHYNGFNKLSTSIDSYIQPLLHCTKIWNKNRQLWDKHAVPLPEVITSCHTWGGEGGGEGERVKMFVLVKPHVYLQSLCLDQWAIRYQTLCILFCTLKVLPIIVTFHKGGRW